MFNKPNKMSQKTRTVLLDESIDFSNSDNASQHLAEPLRVNEVEMAKVWVVVMEKNAWKIERSNAGGLFINMILLFTRALRRTHTEQQYGKKSC